MKFSVLIPTKDRLDLLKYAVESILNQTYIDFEIVISDNCSKQDIEHWIKGLEDKRIVYFRQKSPVSVTENWNTANDMASGDYIIMLGDDDALLPDSLQKLYEYIHSYNFPQLIEFPTYHYLQPNVDPIEKEGSVQSSPLLFGGEKANLVSLAERHKRVKECFQFNYTFGFNMQFYCYRKELVAALKQYGNFYEPPYPDYYTACMMMLVADTVLHIPEKITIIGITRKSYGFYYRNNIEKEGMEFHKEADYRKYAPEEIRDKLCSVDEIHTAAIATFSLIPMRINFEKPDLIAYYKQVIKRELEKRDISEVFQIIKTEMLPHLDYNYKIEVLQYTLNVLKKLQTSFVDYKSMKDIKLSYPNILEVIKHIEYIEKHLSTPNGERMEQEYYELRKEIDSIQIDALKQSISKREVLIWGAYDRGRILKEFLDCHNIKIAGFIDKNPNIQQYLGLPVCVPENIKNKENKYYIMIPLRTVVPEVMERLKDGNYEYMKDYYYVFYIRKLPIYNYTDLFKNKIISELDKVSLNVEFYGVGCEINVTKRFKNDKVIIATLYGNNMKLNFDDCIQFNTNDRDLKQIRVEHGRKTEQEPTIEWMDCIKRTVKIPFDNGYTVVFNSEKILAWFEVTSRD